MLVLQVATVRKTKYFLKFPLASQREWLFLNTLLDKRLPWNSKRFIEPFRIRQVQPIRSTTREERVSALRTAGNNVFLFKGQRCAN